MSDKLAPIYASVQGGHAIAQWLLEHPNQSWNNHTLVYLACDIEEWKIILEDYDITEFHEPDLDNKLTALAICTNNQRMFKKLKLLK